jgi:hypothetical protein
LKKSLPIVEPGLHSHIVFPAPYDEPSIPSLLEKGAWILAREIEGIGVLEGAIGFFKQSINRLIDLHESNTASLGSPGLLANNLSCAIGRLS